MNEKDLEIARVMTMQYGLVTLEQARAAGLTVGQVQRRVRSGRWERVGPSIYRLVGSPTSWRQDVLSACLPTRDVVASRLTAAALHRIAPAGGPIEVTVPLGRSTRSRAVTIHQARLHPIDRELIDRIPVTTVARTLVDLAAEVSPGRLQRLVDDAMHEHRWLTANAIDAAWARSQRAPGRWGGTNLRAALEEWRGDIKPDSAAEVRLIRL